jgi:hypothetical protein
MADGRQSCTLKGCLTVDTKRRQNRELRRDVQAPKPPIHSQLRIVYVRYVDHVVFQRPRKAGSRGGPALPDPCQASPFSFANKACGKTMFFANDIDLQAHVSAWHKGSE